MNGCRNRTGRTERSLRQLLSSRSRLRRSTMNDWRERPRRTLRRRAERMPTLQPGRPVQATLPRARRSRSHPRLCKIASERAAIRATAAGHFERGYFRGRGDRDSEGVGLEAASSLSGRLAARRAREILFSDAREDDGYPTTFEITTFDRARRLLGWTRRRAKARRTYRRGARPLRLVSSASSRCVVPE